MAVNMAKLKVFEQIKILFPHCEIVRYAQSSTFLSSIKSGPGKSLRPWPHRERACLQPGTDINLMVIGEAGGHIGHNRR